jgi:hypothetical protein
MAGQRPRPGLAVRVERCRVDQPDGAAVGAVECARHRALGGSPVGGDDLVRLGELAALLGGGPQCRRGLLQRRIHPVVRRTPGP